MAQPKGFPSLKQFVDSIGAADRNSFDRPRAGGPLPMSRRSLR